MQNHLLDVQGLETQFITPDGVVHAVNGISFSMEQNETIGLVGESGCGKSVTMLSVLRLVASPPAKIAAGAAYFNGRDLLKMNNDEIRKVRGAQISMVFQDPMTSFNPLLTIGRQITEPLEIHLGMSREDARRRAAELLDLVGIPNARQRLNDYPHQFSGGMRQRAMIAMALTCNPKLLIADEPTTALDVTIQAQIVDLVRRIRDEFGMAVIWITHDLGIIAGLAQRVIVMYGGYFIEEAATADLYGQPLHPYTRGLLGSLPRIDDEERRELSSIEGMPPVLRAKPAYCPFVQRCGYAIEQCRQANPSLVEITPGHRVACWVDINTGRARS
jgi:oligopeptide transport system ATP-binding protein